MCILDTLEPLGVDWHEESKIKEKEKVWKGEIYPLLIPVVCQHSRNLRDATYRRQPRLGVNAEAKAEGSEGKQSKREKILAEKIMASRSFNIQADEPE